ncbi:MAG: 50S ribosomal protein L11 methyltransferase [Saprospiraceae bacterium]|nr:50S ribosomal protein L11 methyltransferase [Saprospiraceae bacterium]
MSALNYWKYTFHLDATANNADAADILVAYLAELPFDTFEEPTNGLNAYLPANVDVGAVEDVLREMQQQFQFSWEKSFIPAQNWNEIWEHNFHPVIVGNFCAVRADFHEPIPGMKHELVINPKMAFGTGHHETTWQCIAAMEHLPFAQKKILDFGCGTGVLAILASKLGAAEVEAIDIEEESYLNTLENSAVNNVGNVIARCGALEVVKGHDFDGILANINRNVILDALPTLSRLLKPDAWLLVSGILLQDEAIVTDAAAKEGFERKKKTERGNWLCMEFWRK